MGQLFWVITGCKGTSHVTGLVLRRYCLETNCQIILARGGYMQPMAAKSLRNQIKK